MIGLKIKNRFKNLASQPNVALRQDTKEVLISDFRYWQFKILFGLMWGYALFYLVRKNFSMALTGIEQEFGFSNTELGMFLTAHSVLYGIGKFFNGILADRANPRWFMVIGLMASALVNFSFGFSSDYYVFGFLWMLNGWIQSMGWPPCATLLTSWFESKNLSVWWGIWNSSHQFGGSAILVLGGYLSAHFGWRYVFWVPALIAFLGAFILAWALRDRPGSMGLPSANQVYALRTGELEIGDLKREEIEKQLDLHEERPWMQVKTYLLKNPLIWFVAGGNAFVYIVRLGMLDWAPKLLKNFKGIDLQQAGWLVAAFEVAGIFSGLVVGLLADRLFKGKEVLVNAIFMGLLSILLFILYSFELKQTFSYALIFFFIGFLVAGPQMLTSVCAAKFAPKHVSGSATGFIGLFGYIGASLTGVGSGIAIDLWQWDGAILFYLGAALMGFVLFGVGSFYDATHARLYGDE